MLLVPQVYLMFCSRPQGALLGLAVLLAVAVYAVELCDVLIENDSRRDLGGLTSAEYAMHFSMASLRAAALIAFFATTTLADFTAPTALLDVPWWLRIAGFCVLVPGVAAAAVHVALALRTPTASP